MGLLKGSGTRKLLSVSDLPMLEILIYLYIIFTIKIIAFIQFFSLGFGVKDVGT